MNKPLLEVDVVRAGYGQKTVLNNIFLKIGRGSFVSVIAPNGAGKSTLLRCIAGVLPVQEGSILVRGGDVGEYSRRELAKIIAVMCEETATFNFTVQQTVAMGRFAHIGRFAGESDHDRAVVRDALMVVGMWEKRGQVMSKLSQGERQKVRIARALAQNPAILLLDEPTSHLDIRNQYVILNLIKELVTKNDLTVVAAIHDINLALHFSTHLVMLKDGEMLASGSPDEVLASDVLKVMYGMDFVLHRGESNIFVQPNYCL